MSSPLQATKLELGGFNAIEPLSGLVAEPQHLAAYFLGARDQRGPDGPQAHRTVNRQQRSMHADDVRSDFQDARYGSSWNIEGGEGKSVNRVPGLFELHGFVPHSHRACGPAPHGVAPLGNGCRGVEANGGHHIQGAHLRLHFTDVTPPRLCARQVDGDASRGENCGDRSEGLNPRRRRGISHVAQQRVNSLVTSPETQPTDNYPDAADRRSNQGELLPDFHERRVPMLLAQRRAEPYERWAA